MARSRDLSKVLSSDTTLATDAEVAATYATKIDFPSSAWTDYSPTLSQGVTVSKTINHAKYLQLGKMVIVSLSFGITSTGTAGSNLTVSLPVTASFGNPTAVGSGVFYKSSGNVNYAGTVHIISSTTVALRTDASNYQSYLGNQPNFAVVNIDGLDMFFAYQSS